MQLPELVRLYLPQCAVRPDRAVVDPPCLDALAFVVHVDERALIQTFLAQSSVEALDMRILYRVARPDELQSRTVLACPCARAWLKNSGPLSTCISVGKRPWSLNFFGTRTTRAPTRLARCNHANG